MSRELREETLHWELAAETITVRIRWFGLAAGCVLVNFIGRDTNQLILNGILAFGALFAVFDTWWSYQGKVFLGRFPLFVSLMEAIYIGLLCSYDHGLESPFRFYYFMSLLVCAFRYSSNVIYATLGLHVLSCIFVAIAASQRPGNDEVGLALMVVLLSWVTVASKALASLVKGASRRLAQLNSELQENQALLEQRIFERTQALQESQAFLVQQEKHAAFGLLAAGIAHEVGNPLAAISSLVQMLSRRDQDKYTQERLHMVDDQLRRIHRTLQELVDFSRPASQDKKRSDIHEIIDAALNIAKYYKRKKGKRIVTRYAKGLPPLFVARDQVVQVLLNLILNAMDATEEGQMIEITTSLESGWLKVAVTDDGVGIPHEKQESLFQAYYTTKPTGTGLGLFVCRHIMENMGGKIELTRSDESQTTFTIYLTDDTIREQNDILPEETRIETKEVNPT
ncbi:Sensor protein ZraS [Polystyrenella longa]|uniref:histidine kinase n=1 Tax=Polystyrenella longa TaxID=2528007 RepID=A0A518CHY9_9PLAN|nr:ATP-binding protein [Polystyrenella longa]QDU78849.1 Sensor protein ZraS [Polystyrenella longa]